MRIRSFALAAAAAGTLIVGGLAGPSVAQAATAAPSAAAAPATASTSAAATGPASELPAHLLTGYWQDFVNGATPLRLSDVPTTYNLVAVAFATATTTPGAVTYSVDPDLSTALGGYTDADFTADIATLHARGQKVILSVGGQNGTISVSDSTSADAFASSVESLIGQYGFDGVDIDLENGVNPTYMSQALHSIAAADPGAIITLAPQTIDVLSASSDYLALALDIKDVLTIMNTQYYNSGSMNGCDGGVYSEGSVDFITTLACTALQAGLSGSQIGLGLPASSSAAGSGYVDPSTVTSALTCLASGTACGTFTPSTMAPDIRGAMDWSINWDASNGYAFANAVSASLGSLS
ncbi:glycosyl hydrolase family 18 protein [Frondihabitans australicus]|uniref:chitinase n=1 Tax=Frondihabitans australicus TaxID=386892 RepID=A0A495IKX5_9MICO|nr:glycosyl hydrolase family 18 protein [Frondihabitans australicus]RKR76624.1 chitinase [Frondihabitans australicus]